MNKEYADKWIAALRSGQYSQTTGRLKSEDGYCCLGVLCDIVKDEVGGKWHDGGFFVVHASLGNLVPEVMRLVGMKSNSGKFSDAYDIFKDGSLAVMNDDEKRSFEYIANFIEQNYNML